MLPVILTWRGQRRFARLLAGVLTVAALLLATGCTRVTSPAPPPAITRESAPEQMYHLVGYCGGACLGLATWPAQVKDGRLLTTLILAYHYAPQWRVVAQECADDSVVMRTGAMPNAHTAAYYAAAQNEIVIDAGLLDEPNPVLAAILAHEVAHCAQRASDGPEDPVACFAQERFAVEWEAYVYAHMPFTTDWTPWVAEEEARQVRWREDTLDDLVLTTWQDDCLGEQWSAAP